MKEAKPTPYLTLMDVARLLQVSESTVRRWLKTGFLSGVKAGRGWRVTREAVDELLEEGGGHWYRPGSQEKEVHDGNSDTYAAVQPLPEQ